MKSEESMPNISRVISVEGGDLQKKCYNASSSFVITFSQNYTNL